MADKAAKTTKQFIRVSIVGFIPAADILDKDSVLKQFSRLATIRNFAIEQMEDAEVKAKDVRRLVSTDSVAEPKGKTDDENKKSPTEENP